MSGKKYKVVSGERRLESDIQSVWKIVSYFGILALVCVISFLIAKYIVRNDINGEESPIDTSERL